MREIRLFIDAPLFPGLEMPLPDGAARHALRVLRLEAGDRVTLFNGDGHQYSTRLVAADPRAARVRIEDVESPRRESSLSLTLVQALARGEKMDWIIQKATELGVARIVPIVSERGEVKLDAARSEKRLGHWRAIAISACEQCGRNVIPDVDAPVALDTWLAREPPAKPGIRWMLHPGGTMGLRDLAPPPGSVSLAVGPEGGFGDHDLAILRQAGYRELTLGPRILRTETAGIAALAALQAMWGDF
ncbi:MAG: 16S rRNA (uracil(1498)-N(3))-methyltransferase [Rhodanobacteraceae bacterium]|nr:MAG: 16S rRNA (uracil(1498)-N(3))-methyltransferase [Rhodanobacteraceae bacterium]